MNNLAPSSVQVFSAAAGFDEGQEATISILALDGYNAYTSSRASDTYGLTIDWGDGQTETVQVGTDVPGPDQSPSFITPGATLPPPPNPPLPVPTSNVALSAKHTYKDDDPTATPQDYYTVQVTVTDDDTGAGSGSGTVLIKNVKPTLQIDHIDPINAVQGDGTDLNPSRIDEGEGFKVYGTLWDVGVLDTHTGNIKVDLNYDGDKDDAGETAPVAFTAGGTGVWTFVGTFATIPDDGRSDLGWESNITPSDQIQVLVEARDDDMASSEASVTASSYTTVHNVPPQVYGTWTPLFDNEGHIAAVRVDGSFSDRGVLDEHRLRLEFPDGHVYERYYGPGAQTFTYTRGVSSLDLIFPIIARVRDDDSGESYYTVFQNVPLIDLDIDGDNDNKLDLPEENQHEDSIEASATLPGKIILANVLDHTANGIPDFADGYNIFGNAGDNRSQKFAQLVLKIPTVVDPQVARIKFVYDAADPVIVTRDPVTLDVAEADYAPGTSGSFRIWTRNGDQSRLWSPVAGGFGTGNFVPPFQSIALDAIATGQSYARTVLYVEGVNAANRKAITVLLDVDGDGNYENSDKVYVTIADLHIVFTDVTGIREVGGSTLQTTSRIPADVEPDGVAADWMNDVEDGSILLMRVIGSESLDELPNGFQVTFGDMAGAAFAPLSWHDGEYHALDDGWVSNPNGKLQSLGITTDSQHKVYAARFYRPPIELYDTATAANAPDLMRDIDLAIEVTGDVETTGSKPRAIKLVRPPVVLVHGINSEPGTWGDTPANLDAQGFRSKWFVVDHSGDDPQGTPDEPTFGNGEISHMWELVAQRVAGATRDFRDGQALFADANGVVDEYLFPWANDTKGYRIVVQKVDVVAHSYGGLLTRWYVESPDPNADTGYEARRDVRKVITLGSPHKGAPISNIVAEIYKDGLIANAKAEGAVDGVWEAYFTAMGFSPAWFLPLLTLEPTMKTVVSLLEDTLHTSLPGGGLRPSYQVFSVGSDRIAQLATNPFHDHVAYAAVIGTDVNLHGPFGLGSVNLYHAFQPLTGSSLLPGDDVHLFPWLFNLNRGLDDTDGVVPTWSPALGVTSHNAYIEANHLELTTSSAVFDQVRDWLNSSMPLGSAQRAAYDPAIPPSFANAYVGSKLNAAGSSYGAGLNRDAIIKVELDPQDNTTPWYGTRSPAHDKFIFGTDPTELGPQTVAITGMVQLRSIGNVHAQIVADSTLWPDIVLDDLGQVQAADMFANPLNIYHPDTAPNDWMTFRIETGLLGRNREQAMGPDGTGWDWGWVHYEMQVDNPSPFGGFEAPPAYSGYYYYDVVAYSLPAPQKSATNGLSLTLFGAVMAHNSAAASQTNTVRLYDDDNFLNNFWDPDDDRIDERSLVISHPPGTWDGLLIPYQASVLLVMANGEVQGNQGSSGEATAQVYQYAMEQNMSQWNLSSSTIDVP